MRHSQRGITFIGWLFLLLPIAIVVYAGIRVVPMYLNYMNVSKALNNTAAAAQGVNNMTTLHVDIEKNFDVQSIEHPGPRDLDVHREGDHMVIIADYEDTAPLFFNISLLLQFHKQVEVK